MWKWLMLDIAVGWVLGAAAVAFVIPSVPAHYRGPQLAVLVWLGVIVLYSVLRRVLARRTP